MKFRALTALLCAAALPLAAYAQAPEYQTTDAAVSVPAAAADDPWPFAASDLPVDPDYRVGVLDNGLRYVIRPNGTPAGQGMVYLWVNAGSLGEEPDQAGYAHMVEHMAFNGTTNVPEGEMIRLLEREGLAFGADTNASTTFDRTTYTLDLPRNDEGLLDTALMLMRETASEILFEPEAVAREIGVIHSEQRVRDTFQLRNLLARLEFLYPGSQFAQNWVGGTEETIANATSQRLRDYYERWYRPDNAAVIVVGEFDPDQVEAAIRQHFASWEAPAVEAPASAGPIPYERQGDTEVYLDPALSAEILITRHGPYIDRPDTVESRRERVLRQIGYGIINRRLTRLAREDNPPFRSAGMVTEENFEIVRSTSLVVQAAEGEWERGLAAAQEEYRRAMLYGFSEGEVAEQVANLRAAIESNAAGENTRNNRDFMTGALTLLQDGQVPTTPASALERFEALEPTINPETVLAALKEDVVPLDNPLIRYAGREAPEGGAEALRAAWDEGMALVLQPREEAALGEFAYTDFGTPGTVVSDAVEPLLGIRQITFANGVKLNLKRTDLEEDRVSVQLNIDGGQMLDTREAPLATAMTSSLLVGGLGEHSLDELQSVLAGAQVGLNIDADEETFRFRSTTTPRDLDTQLQLFAAMIADPGYRPQGEEQYQRNVSNFFARLNATPDAALGNELGSILSDNDPRFSLQPEEAYLQLSFAGLRDAIAERWQNGAIELALVGDFDEQAAIDLVAATLGALPPREADFGAWADNRDRRFTDSRYPRILYHQGEDNQALLHMMWPTRDGEDLRETLELELLQAVARSLLLDTLREELGQTYSPSASAQQSRVYPGYGTFAISASLTPDDVPAARDAMLQVIDSLRSAPVDEDTLQRARAPQLEAYDNLLKTNGGWMGLVDRAQTQADRLERYTEGRAVLEALTPEDVQEMALRYLDPAERLEITVLPDPGEAAD
ncbi:M16 family metallopeptidase [Alteraurantiacibacter aquimixticola]|uniref:Insulinase family protein n=1 Tax=Alteraurantiacibacter aquimixticola TaxID=2489173 RepID=A0A4T3F5R4_9SPHN|nr:insulinase family protein [Alteraurantiacibacter aquimixticola]TIX51734.1 insulinase family protein [Alteraurantiacibacter aquimixticola]